MNWYGMISQQHIVNWYHEWSWYHNFFLPIPKYIYPRHPAILRLSELAPETLMVMWWIWFCGIWILSLLSKTGDQCNDVIQVTRPVGEHFKRNVTGLDGHQGVNKMKWDECKGFLSSTVVSIQMGVGAVGAVVQKPCRQRMTPRFLLDANPPSTQLVMLILCVPNSISFSARWLWRGQILVRTHLTLLNCCVRVYINVLLKSNKWRVSSQCLFWELPSGVSSRSQLQRSFPHLAIFGPYFSWWWDLWRLDLSKHPTPRVCPISYTRHIHSYTIYWMHGCHITEYTSYEISYISKWFQITYV